MCVDFCVFSIQNVICSNDVLIRWTISSNVNVWKIYGKFACKTVNKRRVSKNGLFLFKKKKKKVKRSLLNPVEK